MPCRCTGAGTLVELCLHLAQLDLETKPLLGADRGADDLHLQLLLPQRVRLACAYNG